MKFKDDSGKVYRTVKIGGMVWMAQNLNYKIEDSWFYDDDKLNGKKYGRLYTLDAAIEACPDGWRLPNDDDWSALQKAVGDVKKLRSSTDDWTVPGTNDYGFSALPGGMRDDSGCFRDIKSSGYWWSTSKDRLKRYGRIYWAGNRIDTSYTLYPSSGFSVRYIKDDDDD
jgi:uncharacterized protein (TIGR02145 family)